MTCRTCKGPVSKWSKSGLCAPCARRDPELNAKRIAAAKRAYELRPELLAVAGDRLRALAKTPEHAERARRRALDGQFWKVGQAYLGGPGSPVRLKAGRSESETKLAHIPPECREEYKFLVRSKRLKADEAARIVLEHHAEQMARFVRRLLDEAA